MRDSDDLIRIAEELCEALGDNVGGGNDLEARRAEIAVLDMGARLLQKLTYEEADFVAEWIRTREPLAYELQNPLSDPESGKAILFRFVGGSFLH